MISMTINRITEATALSLGQVFIGIDSNGRKLLTAVRNLDTDGCLVNTANGLVRVWYRYHTNNREKIRLEVVSNQITMVAEITVHDIKDLFDPWLKDSNYIMDMKPENWDSTEAWLAELREK